MNIDRVQRQLEIDEGVEFEIYEDHLGYPTFGVGHLVLKTDEEYGQPIGSRVDSDRVNSAFKHDLAVAVDECWKLAATEGRDSLWYRQVGNRAERLMKRLEDVAEDSRNTTDTTSS